MRYIVAVLLIALGLAGCSHAAPVVPSADAQVCSHVTPGQFLMYPGGDWKSPTVAAVASGASPLVQDAYFAAASAPFPEASNWAETYPPFNRAMTQLATVCAAVRANASPAS